MEMCQMDYNQDNPVFFTLIKNKNTRLLKVPKKFLKQLNEDLSDNVIFIGPFGDQWQVTILKKEKDVYMQNGWLQFLKDNLVDFDEMLFFTYYGGNCFHVQIFGTNGLDRLYLKETTQEENLTLSIVKSKKSTQRISSKLFLNKSRSCPGDQRFRNKGSLSKDFPNSSIKIECSEAFKLAESFTSCNPHWKRLMTRCNVDHPYVLPIATEFAKYIPEAVKQICLWNFKGNFWEVTVHNFRKKSKSLSSSQLTSDDMLGSTPLPNVTFSHHSRHRLRPLASPSPTTLLHHLHSGCLMLWNSLMTTGKYPDFFKVYLPEQHSERMLIPNALVKLSESQGMIPEDVILRNASGGVWHIKTRYIGDKLYLDDGWKAFQEENYLGKADFLVFKHERSNEFKVIILELSTQCEKTLVKMEEENEEDQAPAQQVQEAKMMEEEDEGAEDCDIESEKDTDEDDYHTEMEKEVEEEHDTAPAGHTSQSCGKACKREIASSSNPKAKDPLEGHEFDPEIYIQPENQFFKAKLYKNRPNELVRNLMFFLLHISGYAIQNFSLTFAEKVTLICCQCYQLQDTQRHQLRDYHRNLAQQAPIRKKYLEVTGKVCSWQDGRICIKGWADFSRRNKIKKSDVCFCEVTLGEDQVARTLHVHVVGARRE
ncbi:hypothetical protein VNO78_05390 [Psophocarpus tetragonolobus]|uniref:TF-B3 domain-containing protein n=1 Tax=Psophocarpus tetragonolobus TaxID=3891 RepID=A0AAN9T0L6_PSOTE